MVGAGAALVIDAGSSLREGARLRAEACRLLGGARVTHLALTHPHFDHVFGAAAFAGVEVFGAVGVDGVLSRDHEALRADAVHHGLPPADATEAADLLVELFGDRGKPTRAAIGCQGLGGNASVEIIVTLLFSGTDVRAPLARDHVEK